MCLIFVNLHNISIESIAWIFPFYNLVNIIIMIMTTFLFIGESL